MKKALLFILFLPSLVFGQNTDQQKKLSFTGDFRFRLEQDWNSMKSDGSFRTDRSRLRYRVRFGVNYQYNSIAQFGFRVRTGFANKQQDPQLTLGDGSREFGTLPVSFEKLFFKYEKPNITFWLGKNSFSFQNQHELFWSDNVFPEGIFISKNFPLTTGHTESLKLNLAHYILGTNGSSFSNDSHFQGLQLHGTHFNKSVQLFASLYYFKNIPDIPDGNGTYLIDYSFLHLGTKIILSQNIEVSLGIDYYHNFEDLASNGSIPANLNDQTDGLVVGLNIGTLKEAGDWFLTTTFTYLERFAAVDFLAQNDWARWDYSSDGSLDGRLTNFKGFEIHVGYMIEKNWTFKTRFFSVNQLVSYGVAKENGSRIRFDLDIGF